MVIFMYDDLDGLDDHQMGPIINPLAATSSNASDEDQSNGAARCGTGGRWRTRLKMRSNDAPAIAQRGPLLVMSRRAKDNFVDHTVTSQTSPIRFIEENWNLGRLGNDSFDQLAGPIHNMFEFDRDHVDGRGDDGRRTWFLNAQTGQPTSH